MRTKSSHIAVLEQRIAELEQDKRHLLGVCNEYSDEAKRLRARIAELEAALREIGSYELNYARQESPLEALLALQRYARAALEGKG